MPSRRDFVPACLALGAGVGLWLAATALTGKREAWDASAYWTVAYPVAIFVAAGLGFLFCDRPWRWALLLFAGQFLAMSFRASELGGLWPLGLGLFAVMALPAILAASLAARFSGSSRYDD